MPKQRPSTLALQAPAPGGIPASLEGRSPSALLRLPRLRNSTRADWLQLARFCAVGSSGYVINLTVFTAVLTLGGTGHELAAIAAFTVAWCSNFALNRSWTFRGTGRSPLAQALRYLGASLLALGLSLGVLDLLVTLGVTAIVAQATAIAVVTPASFLLNRRWTFR